MNDTPPNSLESESFPTESPRGMVQRIFGCAGAIALLGLPSGAEAARVAHEGFSRPSLVNSILREAGHVPRALGAWSVESGALSSGDYDVFVVSRNTTLLGASADYADGVAAFLAAGGSVVTELSGLAIFLSSYAPDARASMRSTAQLGIFDGVVHAGAFHATGTPIHFGETELPLLSGLPNPFVDGRGTEFFVWFETSDADLTVAGHMIGNGRSGFPVDQELPILAFGCHESATVVLSGWDWNDTLPLESGMSRAFLLNAIEFAAANGCGVVDVAVDVKPGSARNTLNPRKKGVVPVAILTTHQDRGEARTFDAAEINGLTLKLGPDGASPRHRTGHLDDVDGDGDLDLLLHFPVAESGVTCDDTILVVTGETWDRRLLEGSDAVGVVGCPGR